MISSAELFRAIFASSQAYYADPRSVSLQFFVGHSQTIADVKEFLPVAEDRDVDGYAARVFRALDGQDFALSIQHVQEYAPEIWLHLRGFLSSLAQFVALPDQFTKATLFFGSYRKEPRGIHLGNSSNFKFVVHGKKRMRFWPSRFFRGREGASHSTNYERFLSAATTLEVTVGDIIYWPSDSWHVVECVDGLAASISLALFVNSPSSALSDFWHYAIQAAEDRLDDLDRRDPKRFRSDAVKLRVKKIPQIRKLAAAAFTSAAHGAEAEETLRATWLNRASSSGFDNVPSPLPRRKLDDEAVIQADPNYPILWLPGADGEIICSANGHAFCIAAHSGIVGLLEHLNSGAACRVEDLIKKYTGTRRVDGLSLTATPHTIRVLLEKLYSLRAVTGIHF